MEDFIQALNAAFRRRKSSEDTLTWSRVARETDIDRALLWRVMHGEARLLEDDLLQVLLYLGCNEDEQIYIFKLSRQSHPIEQDEAKLWAKKWIVETDGSLPAQERKQQPV